MKIYTKTGDDGTTGLIGERRSKADIRIESYGTVDELNANLHVAVSMMKDDFIDLREEFMTISHMLFDCGAMLADPSEKLKAKIGSEQILWLENLIDGYSKTAGDMKGFILPGGCALSSAIHVCRTIARRAERCMIALDNKESISGELKIFMNRLSDYLFAAARAVNIRSGHSEMYYKD